MSTPPPEAPADPGLVAPAPDAVRAGLLELVGRTDIGVPGGGRTAERFRALTDASRRSMGLGRLFEAHADAEAILAEADRPPAGELGLLGVWASEGRDGELTLDGDASVPVLRGTKSFCSGAAVLDHALVSVPSAAGPLLCLVPLGGPGFEVLPSAWVGPGMRSTLTSAVSFDGVPVLAVLGGPRWYLDRVGFWHGATGVAASWAGGLLSVVHTMRASVDPSDPHGCAHLGEAEAVWYGVDATLERAAREIDGGPETSEVARLRALRARRVVAAGCIEVLEHAAAALGPRSLAFDADHAQRVVDLDVYVRQEHGRRDAESLGRAVLAAEHGR